MYNIVDYAIVGILVACVIYGLYQGGIVSSLHTGAFFLSWFAGWIYYPRIAESVLLNENIYDYVSQYLEGSKMIPAAFMRQSVVGVNPTELAKNMEGATNVPDVLLKFVDQNITKQTLTGQIMVEGQSTPIPQTIGSYFDNTIAMVAINIVSFLLVVFATFLVLTAIINLLQYVMQTPLFRQFDWLVGGAMGLLRGYFIVHCIAALVPIGLTLVNNNEMIKAFFTNSVLFHAYYEGNKIIQSISGFI